MTTQRHYTPRQLDWLCNGVPVYIRRNTSGNVYATTVDLSAFLKRPELVKLRIRLKSIEDIRLWDPMTDPYVQAVVKQYSCT